MRKKKIKRRGVRVERENMVGRGKRGGGKVMADRKPIDVPGKEKRIGFERKEEGAETLAGRKKRVSSPDWERVGARARFGRVLKGNGRRKGENRPEKWLIEKKRRPWGKKTIVRRQ